MSTEAPEFLTTEQVKANVEITPKTVLVVIGGRFYKRDGATWCCLDYGRTQGDQ